MNNYIDERFFDYQRPRMPENRPAYARYERKSAPLARKQNKDGIIIRSLRIVAAIFLLLLSTFGGDEVREADTTVGKAIKTCLIYAGAVLGLWFAVVLLGNIANAATLLPMWSLIILFAAALLIATGVKTK